MLDKHHSHAMSPPAEPQLPSVPAQLHLGAAVGRGRAGGGGGRLLRGSQGFFVSGLTQALESQLCPFSDLLQKGVPMSLTCPKYLTSWPVGTPTLLNDS